MPITPPIDKRPGRVELFAFYYLGFDPAGNYRFPNVRHVAAFYNVSHDAVLRWLGELELSPSFILRSQYPLAVAQVDLQMEASNLTMEGIQEYATAILADLDKAPGGRKPWEGEF